MPCDYDHIRILLFNLFNLVGQLKRLLAGEELNDRIGVEHVARENLGNSVILAFSPPMVRPSWSRPWRKIQLGSAWKIWQLIFLDSEEIVGDLIPHPRAYFLFWIFTNSMLYLKQWNAYIAHFLDIWRNFTLLVCDVVHPLQSRNRLVTCLARLCEPVKIISWLLVLIAEKKRGRFGNLERLLRHCGIELSENQNNGCWL